MKLIERKQYLDKMIGVIGTPDIKVLTGVRRSGKSKLLEAFKSYVQENIPNANIIHINFNLSKYDNLKESIIIYENTKRKYISELVERYKNMPEDVKQIILNAEIK